MRTEIFAQALAEYIMERLLLRDRAGPNGGLPGSVLAAGGNPVAGDARLAGGLHDDVAAAAAAAAARANAAAAAAAAGRSRMKSTEKESPVRLPAPKDVKAVRPPPPFTLLLALVQNLHRGPHKTQTSLS